jgi:hypothetical protein
MRWDEPPKTNPVYGPEGRENETRKIFTKAIFSL